MEQDEKSKRNKEEFVKKLYKEEREKLEKLELWKISEKERLYIIKTPIFEKLFEKIIELPSSYDIDGLRDWHRKTLPTIDEVKKAKKEKWDKASPEEKAEYEYQKMLVEHLEEYLKENYKVIPIKDFEGKLQFEPTDK